jgi:hypothetical protein
VYSINERLSSVGDDSELVVYDKSDVQMSIPGMKLLGISKTKRELKT